MNKKRINKKLNKPKKNYIFLILILVLLCLGLSQMYLCNRLAGWGEKLGKIEKQSATLEEENKKLKTKLISQRNLGSLEALAKKKGFVDNPEVLNLTPKVPVALNP